MVLRYQKPRNEVEFLLFYGNIKKSDHYDIDKLFKTIISKVIAFEIVFLLFVVFVFIYLSVYLSIYFLNSIFVILFL